jgi:hypothetical protein
MLRDVLTLFIPHNELGNYVSGFTVGIDLRSIVLYLKMKGMNGMKNCAIYDDFVKNLHDKAPGYSTVTL